MTTSEPGQTRPVPDAQDLRLLAEIISTGAIGLPQAAWNARMSQQEAAARLVTMAERGMPLRLVAEGDRELLWRIAQAGPATSGVPLPVAAPPLPAPVPPPATAAPTATLPPPSAVPPHEQAIAGAVPLGQPPFGPPAPDASPTPTAAAPPPPAPPATPAPPTPAPAPPAEPAPSAATQAPTPTVPPTRRVLVSGQPVQAVMGLSGEQLDVGLQQIIDPADSILAAAGHRVADGERALLVQVSVGNRGPAEHASPGDLYLVLVASDGRMLGRAALTVEGYPPHRDTVPASTLVSGWSVFLVPAATEVAEVRWSVRPDLAGRTVSWHFGPAASAAVEGD